MVDCNPSGVRDAGSVDGHIRQSQRCHVLENELGAIKANKGAVLNGDVVRVLKIESVC